MQTLIVIGSDVQVNSMLKNLTQSSSELHGINACNILSK